MKKAFTLAELCTVIIILGIIVVIVAKITFKTPQGQFDIKFDKTASVISSNIQSGLMKRTGFAFNDYNGNNAAFFSDVTANLNGSRSSIDAAWSDNTNVDGVDISNYSAFLMNDGTVIAIDNAGTNIFIDVNGKNRPNEFGRDIFRYNASAPNRVFANNGGAGGGGENPAGGGAGGGGENPAGGGDGGDTPNHPETFIEKCKSGEIVCTKKTLADLEISKDEFGNDLCIWDSVKGETNCPYVSKATAGDYYFTEKVSLLTYCDEICSNDHSFYGKPDYYGAAKRYCDAQGGRLPNLAELKAGGYYSGRFWAAEEYNLRNACSISTYDVNCFGKDYVGGYVVCIEK